MVWFQCEDCGDNLKKPKLPNHFRVCSASKLSCIDCGEIFRQDTVERHTQCISEAEKYGPKGGQVKASNGSNAKPKNESKQKPEVDINVGLSERPPWFCGLCNTKATSKQALLLHADGKKHRGKARAHQLANQKAGDSQETKSYSGNDAEKNVTEAKESGEPTDQNISKIATVGSNSGVENNGSKSSKKRKLDASEKDDASQGVCIKAELVNGEAIHINGAETDVKKSSKKHKHSEPQKDAKPDPAPVEETGMKKIKWKKLITSALQSNPDSVLKFKELKKLIVKSLKESGHTEDKNQVSEILKEKVNSSSRFVINGKYVSLVTST